MKYTRIKLHSKENVEHLMEELPNTIVCVVDTDVWISAADVVRTDDCIHRLGISNPIYYVPTDRLPKDVPVARSVIAHRNSVIVSNGKYI